MTELMRFEGHEVRITLEDGEPLFCAADVCRVLDIANNRDALSRLEEDEKGVVSTDTPGGAQELQHVTEAGLYRLVLGSRKPEAKRLQRWVTHDVLPAIRKTGGYGPGALDLNDPAQLQRLALQLTGIVQDQQKQLESAAPKIKFVDELVDATGLLGLQAAAKTLAEPPNLWIRWLKHQGHVYDRAGQTYARQDHLDAGHMVQRVVVVDGRQFIQTRVTPRGLVYFAERRPGLRCVRRSIRPGTTA